MNKVKLLAVILTISLGFSSCIVVTPGPRRYGYGGGGSYRSHHHGHHYGGGGHYHRPPGCR